MYQKINIILPEQTVLLIEKITDKAGRSTFVEDAVKYYVEHVGKDRIREQLKLGGFKRAQRDLKLSEEWNTLEDNIW
jgi:CopG family transcriptional regulator / antitoxin EndoAI